MTMRRFQHSVKTGVRNNAKKRNHFLVHSHRLLSPPRRKHGTLLDVPAATAQRALLPPPRRQHPGDALCHMSLKMQRIGARTISCNLCVQLIFSGKVRSCPRSKTAYCSNRTSSIESLTCHTFSSSYSVKQASISACL